MVDAQALGEQSALRSMGITEEQSDKLHQVAETERLRQRAVREAEALERVQKLEQEKRELKMMEQKLRETGKPFAKLFLAMRNEEQRAQPRDDGGFLIVRKAGFRLLMAVTNNGNKKLQGMELITRASNEIFNDISQWQIVMMFDNEPRDAFFWDKEALGKHDQYLRNAAQVGLGGFGNRGEHSDYIKSSFAKADKLLTVPQAMLQV